VTQHNLAARFNQSATCPSARTSASVTARYKDSACRSHPSKAPRLRASSGPATTWCAPSPSPRTPIWPVSRGSRARATRGGGIQAHTTNSSARLGNTDHHEKGMMRDERCACSAIIMRLLMRPSLSRVPTKRLSMHTCSHLGLPRGDEMSRTHHGPQIPIQTPAHPAVHRCAHIEPARSNMHPPPSRPRQRAAKSSTLQSRPCTCSQPHARGHRAHDAT
jgi:hypothetical protein